MSRLARVTQYIFGSNAGTQQLGQIGSLANGSPTYTTNLSTMQALSNYLTGLYGCLVGVNSPAAQDINSLFFLITSQLAEIFQDGVPPWDAGTTYFKGSLVSGPTGIIYTSLADTNLNNALNQTAYWWAMSSPGAAQVVIGTTSYCTHATLAAAVADSNVGTNIEVLLTDSYTVPNSTLALTKAGWRIRALPGVTYTAAGSSSVVSAQATGIEFRSLRLAGFNTAIAYASGGTYGRVLDCNFNSCTTDVDTSAVPNGKLPVTLGNIDE